MYACMDRDCLIHVLECVFFPPASFTAFFHKHDFTILTFFSFLVHRSSIFPFLIRGGKPTPFIPFILAFVFCVLNGYLQGGYILKYADFGSKWMWNSRFYLGNVMKKTNIWSQKYEGQYNILLQKKQNHLFWISYKTGITIYVSISIS